MNQATPPSGSVEACAETMITGTFIIEGLARIASSTSQPLFTGIFRSRMRSCGSFSIISRSVSRPSAAPATR